MLILWQDQVAAEAHAEAAASAAVALEVAHAVASQVEAAASEVAHLAADPQVVLAEVLIILPHPHIITTTDRISGVQDAAQYFMAVAALADASA